MVDRSSDEAQTIRIPILRSLLHALHFLHSNGFAHADVKLDNLLVTGNGMVQLTDFDLVHVLDSSVPDRVRSIAAAAAHANEFTFQHTELEEVRKAMGTLAYMVCMCVVVGVVVCVVARC